MNMNNEERRFGIHKKYGIDIKRETKKVPPKFYQLVEYNPRGQKIVHAQVYPTQYAVLVSKKKEMILYNIICYYLLNDDSMYNSHHYINISEKILKKLLTSTKVYGIMFLPLREGFFFVP